MNVSRRDVAKLLAAAGGLAVAGPLSATEKVFSWRNWSGGQSCIPASRFAPRSESELADWLKATNETVRPVGSGHSFSGLVPTDGHILSLGRLSGMICFHEDAQQSEWWAGTPMWQMGPQLKAANLALPNMADVDYQTLAGALATSTHGTGKNYTSYSSQVAALSLMTANGELIECDAQNNSEVFHAARASLGALGVITRVTLQNRDAFRVHEKMWLQKTEELLEDVDRIVAENDRWEMQVITHSDYAAAIALNNTELPATSTGDESDEGGNSYVKAIEKLDKYGSDLPAMRRFILNMVAKTASFEERVGDSFAIFANVRNVRFHEMEYEVPAELGPACLREILATIRKHDLRTWFPIEYRYVKGDDVWLSQFQGRDSVAISVHQYYKMDYHNFFAAIEPIFWKYQGRPHWGKLHTLNHNVLPSLYPHWQDFTELRQELDPKGKFLNGHLRSVFGVPA